MSFVKRRRLDEHQVELGRFTTNALHKRSYDFVLSLKGSVTIHKPTIVMMIGRTYITPPAANVIQAVHSSLKELTISRRLNNTENFTMEQRSKIGKNCDRPLLQGYI